MWKPLLRKEENPMGGGAFSSKDVSELGSKWGFTLAEVLITLGIIGVVAALTIPQVVQNYQKQATATALKKAPAF